MVVNSENIGNFIKNPELISGDLLIDFEGIKNKYPYCSTAYLLHLKSLSKSNNLHFNEHLKLAAAHSMDGERMYHLVHDEVLTVSKPLIEKEEIIEDIVSKKVEVDQETIKETIEPLSKELNEGKKKKEPVKLKKKTIKKISKEKKIDTSKFTFIEWLKYKQAIKDSESKFSNKILEKGLNIVEDKPKKLSKREINELLDKFIAEQPRISSIGEEQHDSPKNAKKSLEDSFDIVSETLAEIHVMQKNYSKAITAYEKLILLYPEKKTFFASRIEKIIAEQNN